MMKLSLACRVRCPQTGMPSEESLDIIFVLGTPRLQTGMPSDESLSLDDVRNSRFDSSATGMEWVVGEVFGMPCPQTWTPSDEVKQQIFGFGASYDALFSRPVWKDRPLASRLAPSILASPPLIINHTRVTIMMADSLQIAALPPPPYCPSSSYCLPSP
eukprot:scaffold249345_cov64-Cyclotella_meneghiniana.AAC.1